MIRKPNDIVAALVADFSGAFGADLLNITLYGNAVSHEFVPGHSTITFLIVVSDISPRAMIRGMDIHHKWLRRGIASPQYLTSPLLSTFGQVFPVELLNMQHAHRVLFGDDVLSQLVICKEALLLQCKRNLAVVAAFDSMQFLMLSKNNRSLAKKLHATIEELLPVFRSLLALYDRKIPHGAFGVITAIEDLFGLGVSILSDLSIGKNKGTGTTDFESYCRFFDVLAIIRQQFTNFTIANSDTAGIGDYS